MYLWNERKLSTELSVIMQVVRSYENNIELEGACYLEL